MPAARVDSPAIIPVVGLVDEREYSRSFREDGLRSVMLSDGSTADADTACKGERPPLPRAGGPSGTVVSWVWKRLRCGASGAARFVPDFRGVRDPGARTAVWSRDGVAVTRACGIAWNAVLILGSIEGAGRLPGFSEINEVPPEAISAFAGVSELPRTRQCVPVTCPSGSISARICDKSPS